MQFMTLPEPHIYCSHVLARTPLLFRLNVRNYTGEITVTEYADPRRPFFEMDGNPAEIRALYRRAVDILRDDVYPRHEPPGMPLFTLDLRPDMFSNLLVIGFNSGWMSIVAHGDYTTKFRDDLRDVSRRLADLGQVFWPHRAE